MSVQIQLLLGCPEIHHAFRLIRIFHERYILTIKNYYGGRLLLEQLN